MKENKKSLQFELSVWLSLQALWVWITLSPVLIINTSAAAAPLVWTDAFGKPDNSEAAPV